MVHILKQTQRELELILTNPFVHVTYHSYHCLFQKTINQYRLEPMGILLLPVIPPLCPR